MTKNKTVTGSTSKNKMNLFSVLYSLFIAVQILSYGLLYNEFFYVMICIATRELSWQEFFNSINKASKCFCCSGEGARMA